MSVYKKENNFYSLLVILLSIFILFLFTFGKVGDISEKLLENNILIDKQKDIEKKLIKLNQKKKELIGGKRLNEILKYNNDFSEDEILLYLNEKATDVSLKSPNSFIRIKSINFEESYLGELGFKESNITITADFGKLYVLKNFLDYLTDVNADYTFIITNFSLPSNYDGGSLRGVTIPLKYIHK